MATKNGVVVKLVLVFFVSLLSFSIGTFVGKKYSDNQHKLAALEPGRGEYDATRDIASAHEPEVSSGSAVTDDEIARIAEEFAEDDGATKHETASTSHDPHAAPPAPAEAPTKHEPSPAARSASGGAPAEPTAPVVKAKPEPRVPTSLPKDVAQYAVGKFTVQIASLANEAEAKKKAEGLKEKGYGAFYVPAQVKGQTWYRVNVGLFPTENEAKSYRSEFMQKNGHDGAIVQKLTN